MDKITFSDVADIFQAVDNGIAVYWENPAYTIVKTSQGYDLKCSLNGSRIGIGESFSFKGKYGYKVSDFYYESPQTQMPVVKKEKCHAVGCKLPVVNKVTTLWGQSYSFCTCEKHTPGNKPRPASIQHWPSFYKIEKL